MPFNMPNIYVECIDELAKSKDHSMLKALGISGDIDNDSSSDESTDDDSGQSEFDLPEPDQQTETVQYDTSGNCKNSRFNFFDSAEQLKKCSLSPLSILDLL